MAPAQNLLSDEDYDKLIDENKKLENVFINLVKKSEFNKAKKIRLFMSGLNKIHSGGIKRVVPCGVGTNHIAIDINGDIFPCHRFVANKEYAIGNVLINTINNHTFINEIEISNHKNCKSCWAKNLCVGSCPNENLVNTGSTQTTSKKSCKYSKALFDGLINIYINLTPIQKSKLFG